MAHFELELQTGVRIVNTLGLQPISSIVNCNARYRIEWTVVYNATVVIYDSKAFIRLTTDLGTSLN